jgi:hypothetical protein
MSTYLSLAFHTSITDPEGRVEDDLDDLMNSIALLDPFGLKYLAICIVHWKDTRLQATNGAPP